ncbi:MAG: hypothetical protein PHI97_28130 [Desulfobulbus sp.]|nr:hypothetical protein [Desulfobulbus sp.]
MSGNEKDLQQGGGKTGLGYEEMVWIRDQEGNEYACQFNDIKFIKKKEELSEEESKRCVDVSHIIGKGKW